MDADGLLRDAHGRRITYLRLSVTDRCNFRCVYCSPAHWSGKEDFLGADELVRLVTVFASLGVSRVRLTGGEPLLRPDLVAIATRIAALDGIRELCLTTNGDRLEDQAQALRDAGVSTLNVSVDTTDPQAFRALTERGRFERVERGLEAARRAGFARLGTNAVVVAGVNDAPSQLANLVRFSWIHGATPRFIELMPFAGGGDAVPSREVLARLATEGIVLEPVGARTGAGPASYWRAPDGREVGLIGAMTENFCERCNRVRVTSKGELRACLGGRDQVPLAPLLRSGANDDAVRDAVRGALATKWDRHRFHERNGLLPMMSVGG